MGVSDIHPSSLPLSIELFERERTGVRLYLIIATWPFKTRLAPLWLLLSWMT